MDISKHISSIDQNYSYIAQCDHCKQYTKITLFLFLLIFTNKNN